METNQEKYLKQIVNLKHNGLVKLIIGARYERKTFLLNPILYNWLLSRGIKDDHIIKIDFDKPESKDLLTLDGLNAYIRSRITDSEMYYLLLSEIQFADDYQLVVNGLLGLGNTDIYVTVSDLKGNHDLMSQLFLGRVSIVNVYPLSYSEFEKLEEKGPEISFRNYTRFGGMPRVLRFGADEDRINYLKSLVFKNFKEDIMTLNGCYKDEAFDYILAELAKSTGKITNANQIYKNILDNTSLKIVKNTVISYLDYLIDSFMLYKIDRYDIKKKTYLKTPSKYYFCDHGLRNAILDFNDLNSDSVFENIIFVELLRKEYSLNVGIIESQAGGKRTFEEIDFVCSKNNNKVYVQTTTLNDENKAFAEVEKPLLMARDGFRKVIICNIDKPSYVNENGIYIIGIKEFLTKQTILD